MSTLSGRGTPNSATRKVMAIAPISASTAQTSTGIDVRGWDWLEVNLLIGTMAGGATIDLTLEGSDALGGTYTAIAGAVMAQRVAASHASKIFYGMVDLTKRPLSAGGLQVNFIRVVATCATAASLVAVECILSNADRTERVQAAQLGSSPVAVPIAGTDALFSI